MLHNAEEWAVGRRGGELAGASLAARTGEGAAFAENSLALRTRGRERDVAWETADSWRWGEARQATLPRVVSRVRLAVSLSRLASGQGLV